MNKLFYTKQAVKDIEKLKAAGLADKAKAIVDIVKSNPFASPPPFEKLVGDLKGLYSRRINRKHRIWYSVDSSSETVRIIRLWSHYE